MPIEIRELHMHDAERVAELSGQLGYTISVADTAEQLRAIAENPNDAAFAATDDGRLIGWVHVFYTLRVESPPFCEIGGLVVDEARRGKGIGKMLTDAVRPWCYAKKCRVLRVRCNAKRTEAHQFYEHCGFKEIKQQKIFETEL